MMRLLAFFTLSILSSSFAEEYYISRYAAAIVPQRMLTVPMQEAGVIEIHHRGDGHVAKGTLLLKINAKELELEEAELKNQQRLNAANANEALLQLQRRKEEMEFIMAQPLNRRQFVEPRLKVKADQQALDILNEKIAIQKEALRISNEKLQQTFDKLCETRIIRMPFDGRIQYHITLGEAAEQQVAQTGPILTAVDDGALYAAITPAEAEVANLPTDKLILLVETGQGKHIQGRWHHKKIEKRNSKESLVYYFKLNPEDHDTARAMMGANTVAELHYQAQADENLVYVPKIELAKEAGTCNFETWEELVNELRPGYKILFTGETNLCLYKAN